MPRLLQFLFAAILSATAAEAAPTAGQTTLKPGVLAPRTVSPNLPTVQTGTILAPLSAQECKDLGGEVGIAGICKSGQSCQRKDEDGKTHEVCLSAK